MQKKLLLAGLLLAGTGLVQAQKMSKSDMEAKIKELNSKIELMEKQAAFGGLNTELDKVSYALGMNMASNFIQQGFDEISMDAFSKAFDDVYGKKSLMMDPQESSDLLNEYFGNIQARKFEKVKAEGEKFLAGNKKRKEVITLPSGLQYEIIKAGTGPKPGLSDQVTTHYIGTLIDGTVFDSSVERGQPATFPVNGVIKGWTEALQLMPTGSKWKLYVPYDLAYGERGAGQQIGPFSTLIFEVELISVNK